MNRSLTAALIAIVLAGCGGAVAPTNTPGSPTPTTTATTATAQPTAPQTTAGQPGAVVPSPDPSYAEICGTGDGTIDELATVLENYDPTGDIEELQRMLDDMSEWLLFNQEDQNLTTAQYAGRAATATTGLSLAIDNEQDISADVAAAAVDLRNLETRVCP